ncbi:hypothetical protein SDC9_184501 [bioreactor metagenome]|uniref:Uncharacterized protein n=1 Tax=bioreactor metagenome TaxID=1076179 RepID=A0A645HFP6_9ZZZZ
MEYRAPADILFPRLKSIFLFQGDLIQTGRFGSKSQNALLDLLIVLQSTFQGNFRRSRRKRINIDVRRGAERARITDERPEKRIVVLADFDFRKESYLGRKDNAGGLVRIGCALRKIGHAGKLLRFGKHAVRKNQRKHHA